MNKIETLPADIERAENYLQTIFADSEATSPHDLQMARTVYTLTRKVSKSGMTRYVSVWAIRNGGLLNLTYNIAAACGFKVYDLDGYNVLKLDGAGMDMHFHLAYVLSCQLYGAGNGYAIGKVTI
jgi:hypothetical protein